jgi:hypothetical protein
MGGYLIGIYIAVIEQIVIWFVTWLQLPTKTQEIKWIKNGIFYLTFFEAAVMILLATAPSTRFANTNGRNTDFTTLWYVQNSLLLCDALVMNVIITLALYLVDLLLTWRERSSD